jgi:hypothetical protein
MVLIISSRVDIHCHCGMFHYGILGYSNMLKLLNFATTNVLSVDPPLLLFIKYVCFLSVDPLLLLFIKAMFVF